MTLSQPKMSLHCTAEDGTCTVESARLHQLGSATATAGKISYEHSRRAAFSMRPSSGKLCRIPCLKSTFAAPKCMYCGLQSTTNSGLQSTEHGDDLHQDRGRLTRGSGLLPLASHLDRWLAMHTCVGYKIPKLLVCSSANPKQ